VASSPALSEKVIGQSVRLAPRPGAEILVYVITATVAVGCLCVSHDSDGCRTAVDQGKMISALSRNSSSAPKKHHPREPCKFGTYRKITRRFLLQQASLFSALEITRKLRITLTPPKAISASSALRELQRRTAVRSSGEMKVVRSRRIAIQSQYTITFVPLGSSRPIVAANRPTYYDSRTPNFLERHPGQGRADARPRKKDSGKGIR
jgi:hypothetical protein